MKRTYRWKQAGALALTAAVLGSMPFFPAGGLMTANAAMNESPLDTYSEEDIARFQDNVLEYDEIQGLIEYYNSEYQNQLEVFYGNPDGESGLSRDQLLVMADEFRYEANELREEAKELKDSISKESYKEYQENISTLRKYAKEMEKAAGGTPKTKAALREVRNKLEIELSAKYREYMMLVSKDAVQRKTLELAELTYASMKRQRDLGMCSAEELIAAEETVNAERTAMAASAAALVTGKQNLIMNFGWDYDGSPEIHSVPEPSLEKIAGYDLAKDSEAAITVNKDVTELIKTPTEDFTSSREKQRQISEKKNQVRMQMELLYKDVNQKLASYQIAVDGWNLAESNRLLAEKKLQLGMISRLEYLNEEVTWIKAKSSMEQASMDLVASVETYEWAIKGELTL